MPIEVKIPAVGESITSGVVSVWHKKSGEFVSAGDALFTLETDKVSTEIVAEQDGVLETKVPEGQEVKIGEVVATIDDSKAPPEEKKERPPEKEKEPESVDYLKTMLAVSKAKISLRSGIEYALAWQAESFRP